MIIQTLKMAYSVWIYFVLVYCINACYGTEGEHLEYFILEELPGGTLMGNVAIDAGLTDKYDAPTLDSFRYSFLNQPDPRQKLFAIEETTGIVKTSQVIDRDIICAQKPTCQIWLHVAIQPPQYFQVIKILVDILDVNDHEPEFNDPEISLVISESSYAGKTFSLPTATDADSASYGILYYELRPNSNKKFDLSVIRSKIDNSIDLKLILNEELDRETEDFYQIQLVAYDGGSPPRLGYMLINVTVEDSNDNDPKFDNTSYKVFVSESVPAGANILRVQAHDADQGENGEVVYDFNQRTRQGYAHIFGIDKNTGVISLKQALDFEEESTYMLTVTAHDKGQDSQTVAASVVVQVKYI